MHRINGGYVSSKPRLTAIESLRGMSFLAVVLQHSIAHYANVPEVTYIDGVLALKNKYRGRPYFISL